MATSSADKRLAQIARVKRARPSDASGNLPMLVEEARLQAKRAGRPRPIFTAAADTLAKQFPGIPFVRPAPRGETMATVVRKVRPPTSSKSAVPAKSTPVKSDQSTNPEYYEHLNAVRRAQYDETRSDSHKPVSRSDVGPESTGASSAHGLVNNEEDEGRHESAGVTGEERTRLLARKKEIELMMKMKRRTYNADSGPGGVQAEYRTIVRRLGTEA